MKKVIAFFSVLMAVSCLFAAGAKWKSSDIFSAKKLNKLLETYNLTKSYEKDNIVVYKNEETSDWIYIMREGLEENFDKRVFFISFANLDGVFDSCTIFGGFTGHKENVKYHYSYLNESTTAIQPGDYFGKSNWKWTEPDYTYFWIFKRRAFAFIAMESMKDIFGITIPEDVHERYAYFANWLIDNNNEEKAQFLLNKEYKKYLKEHK